MMLFLSEMLLCICKSCGNAAKFILSSIAYLREKGKVQEINGKLIAF